MRICPSETVKLVFEGRGMGMMGMAYCTLGLPLTSTTTPRPSCLREAERQHRSAIRPLLSSAAYLSGCVVICWDGTFHDTLFILMTGRQQ